MVKRGDSSSSSGVLWKDAFLCCMLLLWSCHACGYWAHSCTCHLWRCRVGSCSIWAVVLQLLLGLSHTIAVPDNV